MGYIKKLEVDFRVGATHPPVRRDSWKGQFLKSEATEYGENIYEQSIRSGPGFTPEEKFTPE